ncbi:MAG: hypothetical protein K5879_02710 [Lachnospiraceae bacterium]|nr:hypothetical protein [Lachnospiraceae bacterium]
MNDYVLLINLKKVPYEGELYAGKYTFSRGNYGIEIYEDGVCVHKYLKTYADSWTFEKIGTDLHDALRKAHLLYALCVGKGLTVTEYRVLRNGRLLRAVNGQTSPVFPFVFSTLAGRDLLCESADVSFNGVFKNKAIMNYFTSGTRTDLRLDKRAVAVYSFLQGRSREFESDRFINYWTAINSIYGYLNERHNEIVEKKTEELREEWLTEFAVTRSELKEFYTPYGDTAYDWKKLGMLSQIIKKKSGIRYKGNCRDMSAAWEEIEKEFADPYKEFAVKYFDSEGKMRFHFRRLYDLARDNKPLEQKEFTGENEKKAYEKMTEWSDKVGCPLYLFLSMYKPYYQRNHYIHGSEVSVLISDTYNLHMLSCLNYFMDQLLSEYVPYLFDDGEMNQLLSEAHQIIYSRRKGEMKKEAKAAEKIAKKDNSALWLNGKSL